MARVMVIDDSAFVRKALTRVLRASPQIEDVTAAASVSEALGLLEAGQPDVLTLDVDMPDMNGLAALREIVRRHPGLPVIMLSALTKRGASITFEALAAGAVDFIDKTSFSMLDLDRMSRELLVRIRLWSRQGPPTTHVRPLRGARGRSVPDLPLSMFDLCVVGASTGGPSAIETIARALPSAFPVPILVAQHMPPGFTRSFAERLDSLSALEVVEASDGDRLVPGVVLVAPAGKQVRIDAFLAVRVTSDLDGERHGPCVDVAMQSAARARPGRVLGVLLTGMGEDGAAGMRAILDSGGTTIAQSEDTCVVFGMPRAAIMKGAAAHVLGLTDIASLLSRRAAVDPSGGARP
jgi:two-component system chemotaxis response regulator CheB